MDILLNISAKTILFITSSLKKEQRGWDRFLKGTCLSKQINYRRHLVSINFYENSFMAFIYSFDVRLIWKITSCRRDGKRKLSPALQTKIKFILTYLLSCQDVFSKTDSQAFTNNISKHLEKDLGTDGWTSLRDSWCEIKNKC